MNIHAGNKTPDSKATFRIQQMGQEEKESLKSFEKLALYRVGDHTEWLCEQPTVKGMAEAIRNTEYGKVRGTPGENARYAVVVKRSWTLREIVIK